MGRMQAWHERPDKVYDVALQRVKCEGWGQTQPCTAGLRQCENMCGYLPQQLYIHGVLATTGCLKGVLSSSICSFLLSSLSTLSWKHEDVPTKMGSFPPLCPPLAIYNLTGVLFLENLFKPSVNTIQNNPDNTDVKNRLLGIFELNVHSFCRLLLSFSQFELFFFFFKSSVCS